jgi:transposase
MRESQDPRYLRLRLVQHAQRLGLKPAARLFGCSPKTIRKWLRRFDGSLASLGEVSRAPHHRPRKLPPQAEAAILRARLAMPTYSPRRLKLYFALPYSAQAIRRVLKEKDLLRRWRRKKHEVKRSLRAVKRLWAAWQQIDLDTKDLSDLPEYWLQAQACGLPRYQYTARDVSTGALFLGFAEELALAYSDLFVARILHHLQAHGVALAHVTVQTDNGSEFVGSWQATAPSAFTRTIQSCGAAHRTIPPGQHRYQADVETVHSLMETEFYLERFPGPSTFLKKANDYQMFFNYLRPNTYKENSCPWVLLRGKLPAAEKSILHLPPAFLHDTLHAVHHPPSGGYDVSVLP